MIELNREIDTYTIVVGDFNISLSVIDISSMQKINNDKVDLNSTINQLELIDIYWTLYPPTEEYTFSSSSHGTFTEIDYILAHETHFNKLKRPAILQSQLSDYSEIKLGIKNTWKSNQN